MRRAQDRAQIFLFMFQKKVFMYDNFILFGVFSNLIKPNEGGKHIANKTSLQF